jgi:hypothetical protein
LLSLFTLDEASVKILNYIKDNAPAKTEDISLFVSDEQLAESCISSLKTKNLIEGLNFNTYFTPNGIKSVSCSPYTITADGLSFLEQLESERPQTLKGKSIKWLKDNILELIAIIISIIALLKP